MPRPAWGVPQVRMARLAGLRCTGPTLRSALPAGRDRSRFLSPRSTLVNRLSVNMMGFSGPPRGTLAGPPCGRQWRQPPRLVHWARAGYRWIVCDMHLVSVRPSLREKLAMGIRLPRRTRRRLKFESLETRWLLSGLTESQAGMLAESGPPASQDAWLAADRQLTTWPTGTLPVHASSDAEGEGSDVPVLVTPAAATS